MDIKKTKQDIVTMIILMIVSALFYFIFIPGQIRLSSVWSGSIPFSSRSFPYILSVGLFIVAGVGLANAIVSLIKLKKIMKLEEKTIENRRTDKKAIIKLVMPFIVYALILIYAILFKQIGYIYSTLIIPPILIFILGSKKWQFYLFTYIFAAVVYVVFKLILNIPIP